MNNIIYNISILFAILCIFNHFQYNLAIIGDSGNVRPIRQNEYPSAVCIKLYNPSLTYNKSLICSGVLISHSHVLTAEHCIHNLNINTVEILIGPGELSKTTSYYSIWWLSFNQWSKNKELPILTKYNDISIVKILGLTIEFSPGLMSSISSVTNIYGHYVQTFGCGRIEQQLLPTTIQTAKLKVLNNQECERSVSTITENFRAIPTNLMCTNNYPYVYTQNGDSGGPVLYKGELVGINLGACPDLKGEVHPNQVNMHVFLNSYKHFVIDVIENSE